MSVISPNGEKTLVLQTRKNRGLFGKGLTMVFAVACVSNSSLQSGSRTADLTAH